MSQRLNKKGAANIYYSKHNTKDVRSHTHSIAMLALSTNLQDSFDKIIQRLLDAHNGHKNGKEETKTLQSDSQVGPQGNQTASVATLSRGEQP